MNFPKIAAALISIALFTPAASQAETNDCGGTYTVQKGDFLIRIARKALDDDEKWTQIYQSNVELIGNNPNLIQIGDVFRIPCLDIRKIKNVDATVNVRDSKNAKIKLLSGDDYQPFTHRGLLNDGLVTHIVAKAFDSNPEISDYGIAWENDWSEHLDPLLSTQEFDMGFPWMQPDCVNTPADHRCLNFIFSESMFEMLILLYVSSDRSFGFRTDADIHGKTLCRPAGYYTHDLEKNGRNWLTSELITLKQPANVSDCFEMLVNGEVDAVALNEFTGRKAISELKLEEKVEIVDSRPLSIEGLHVVVHRDHPNAIDLIQQVNQGLETLKETKRYHEIVEQHMALFWSGLE